jgi:flagellar basal-body rod protein FlgC
MNLISGVNVTASALNAEQVRMDVVAENIANAYTTHTAEGGAYKRKVVSFESMLDQSSGGPGGQSLQVSKITTDDSPGEAIYQPGNPDANKDGMVMMPNVNLSTEMVDLMTSSRAYEANLAVIRNARQMATKALTIGH